jgi:hypothetical protein
VVIFCKVFFEKHLIKSVFNCQLGLTLVFWGGVKFAKIFTSQNWKKKCIWQLQHMFVQQLIKFEIFISKNKIFLKIHYFPSQSFVI